MGKRVMELFEYFKIIVSFMISMVKDVRRFLKEEKADTDYATVANLLSIS